MRARLWWLWTLLGVIVTAALSLVLGQRRLLEAKKAERRAAEAHHKSVQHSLLAKEREQRTLTEAGALMEKSQAAAQKAHAAQRRADEIENEIRRLDDRGLADAGNRLTDDASDDP